MKAPVVELRSGAVGESANRWSYAVSTAEAWIVCDAVTGVATFSDVNGARRTFPDPLTALSWMESFPLGKVPGSRWIGFLSYDLGRWFESLPSTAVDDLRLPLFVFSYHRQSNQSPTNPEYQTGNRPLTSTLTRRSYMSAVRRAIDYIQSGDVFQVNLSQRMSLGLKAQPKEIWERALSQSPEQFAALLDYGDFALISLSPELFLQVNDREVVTRPIKGTRPLGPDMETDLRLSEKDAAELNMIVDLERNDLGRVCEIGSVKVIQPRTIETHRTVYHGVATIAGTLRQETRFTNLLRAMFPGGSITGAPKIRAMQIIEELEPVRRGPYCGAIGYLAANGSMQFNVAIRTMILKDGLVHVPVGGGIVADSDPADEYEETLVKAKAMFDALAMSKTDFQQFVR
jgi:anthranilate/para-aminobenzoate synthase component I